MSDTDPASCRRGSVSDEGESRLGGVTEWLMVADCKSAGLTPYVGSNPTTTTQRAAGQGGGGAVGNEWEAGATRLMEQTAPLPVGPAAPLTRGCSSVGRASAFQAEGREFESRRPLQM